MTAKFYAALFLDVFWPWICAFSYSRFFISGLIDFNLNKNARKKRSRELNFINKLLYTKYDDVVPRCVRYVYYIINIVHVVALIIWIAMCFINPKSYFVQDIIRRTLYVFDILWGSILRILFFQVKGPYFKYERWFKKRGQQKKKR